jgi:acid phosphatase
MNFGKALAGLAIGIVAAARAAAGPLDAYKHIVVIYQENHSFDNLYGLWGRVNGEAVNGLPNADPAHTIQLRQDGMPYRCLLQLDVNLTSPPLAVACVDKTGTPFMSAFKNAPFKIDDTIAPEDTTCPAPGGGAPNGIAKGAGIPGGCTRDIAHLYYVHQYQLDGGKLDRFVTGSDAAGLVMGYYDTTRLPIYAYLHGLDAPHYVIADSFFQGAFGGSFLNHQWLVAAATPEFAGAANDGSDSDIHAVVDANGMMMSTPLYQSPLGKAAAKGPLSASCSPPPGRPATPPGVACGDYAVNTTQPFNQPYLPGTAEAKRLPPLKNPTIGDRLSAAGIDWAWYSGGWANANGDVGQPGWSNGTGPNCADPDAFAKAVFPNCPDKDFQFHHQPFNYFANFAPGTQARAEHLRDEEEFIAAAKGGALRPVSFVKPIGFENEHPGYASVSTGSNHLVELIRAVIEGPSAEDTLVIVTYDEFGGQWDHVPPPGMNPDLDSPHDIWGPGTRVPALLISKKFAKSAVDHTTYDTTSILRTIEEKFHLPPLGERDAKVRSLESAVVKGE